MLWQQNRESLLAYALTSTLGGLRGTVKRRGSTAPLAARITVGNSTTVTRSTKLWGDFYRPLAPSRTPYVVRVTAPGGALQTFQVTVPFDGRGAVLNVVFP